MRRVVPLLFAVVLIVAPMSADVAFGSARGSGFAMAACCVGHGRSCPMHHSAAGGLSMRACNCQDSGLAMPSAAGVVSPIAVAAPRLVSPVAAASSVRTPEMAPPPPTPPPQLS